MITATIRVFKTEAAAIERCTTKNKACKAAGNTKDIYAVVEHPDGFAVVDLDTAIELECEYKICY